ncbi:non-heme iron oxygenase ferredoxin subunit [Helcobacillus massiliensis]|uniref:non-heme iron oxygenase ferredoxin subunit n=1 Tax=Helcobacillus massiliensis TaxID=521392 RepID=UPI0021A8BDCA|nr:non-heme iron oxygenase ferredoxin subunit [Helcobacillus massiliensis]MCT1556954.1 non-heme iron oxygenase ferredoxin subunit [Helcobacillus massiliensis]MCT2035343.1 non-heme iron oxygenase ferredoxin subunit [Helcobacillus massiliensis]MCT2331442.1 non-heme iron oxygenase ferredoxin subunit [Helcobacillus massiliensis]
MPPTFHAAANLADIAPGEVLSVSVAGVDVALARDADSTLHALEDRCSHGEVALSDGDVFEGTLECWKHGSQFDLRTGRPRQLPATEPVAVYPVSIDEATGAISVAVTDPHS